MLGFGSISEFAISDVPDAGGIQTAVLAAIGAGAFAATGARTAAALLSASGAGALTGATNAIGAAVLASTGSGHLTSAGASRAAAILVSAGAGNLAAVPVIFTARAPRGNQITTIDMIVDMGEGGRVPQVNKTPWSERAPPARDKRGRKVKWDS